jgi:glutamine amidotransferase
MSYVTVGIVDYGMGNHASVIHSLRDLGFRVRVSAETGVLDGTDILILPGVGAFPSAMQALHERRLVDYLQQEARRHRPIIGICLGMQLLATASYELQYTMGLDIIPGEIIALPSAKWHIGWDTLENVRADPLFQPSEEQAFYFNHSFCYRGAAEYHICVTRHPEPFPSVIRSNNIVGVQFHPEKSQAAGKILLRNLINGLAHA